MHYYLSLIVSLSTQSGKQKSHYITLGNVKQETGKTVLESLKSKDEHWGMWRYNHGKLMPPPAWSHQNPEARKEDLLEPEGRVWRRGILPGRRWPSDSCAEEPSWQPLVAQGLGEEPTALEVRPLSASPWSLQDRMAGCKLQTRGQLLLEPGSVRVRYWRDLRGSAGRMAGTKALSLLPSLVCLMPSLDPASFHPSVEKCNLQQYMSQTLV